MHLFMGRLMERTQKSPIASIRQGPEPTGLLLAGYDRHSREPVAKILFTVAGFVSVVIMALIVLFLLKEGVGFFFRKEISSFRVTITRQSSRVLEFRYEEGKGPQNYLIHEKGPGIMDIFGGDPKANQTFQKKLKAAFDQIRGGKDQPRPRLRVEISTSSSFAPSKLAGFIGGSLWYPSHEQPEFGMLALLLGSLAVTLVSALIAAPLGMGMALYLSEVASPRLRRLIMPLVELLTSIPSVVLGFLGMVILVPFLQNQLDIPSGLNLTSAAVMLALMAIPTIVSISGKALLNVPRELKEASLALGATRWETLVTVTLPGAFSAMMAATILGMSRAMGETMVVLMVAGGAARIPEGLFDSVRPLPFAIAAEMGETPVGGDHYLALFALGLVLFLVTLGFNLLAAYISRRFGPQQSVSP